MITAEKENVKPRRQRQAREPIVRTAMVSYQSPWVNEKLRQGADGYKFLIEPLSVTPQSVVFTVHRLRDNEKPYKIHAVIREGEFHPCSCDCSWHMHFCKHVLLFMHQFGTMPKTDATALRDHSKRYAPQSTSPTDHDAPRQKQWFPGDEEDFK